VETANGLAVLPQLALSHNAPVYDAMYFCRGRLASDKACAEFSPAGALRQLFVRFGGCHPHKQPDGVPTAAGSPLLRRSELQTCHVVITGEGALDLVDPQISLKRPINLEQRGYDRAYD
jgi:hypothetical protein